MTITPSDQRAEWRERIAAIVDARGVEPEFNDDLHELSDTTDVLLCRLWGAASPGSRVRLDLRVTVLKLQASPDPAPREAARIGPPRRWSDCAGPRYPGSGSVATGANAVRFPHAPV
ncbi:MAG: hypothetical protein OXD50_16440 [Chloroflexi bacterium]|nr:hypothetical protein [Chloroflexota bacterium]